MYSKLALENDVLIYIREYENEKIKIVINLSKEIVEVNIVSGEILMTTSELDIRNKIIKLNELEMFIEKLN